MYNLHLDGSLPTGTATNPLDLKLSECLIIDPSRGVSPVSNILNHSMILLASPNTHGGTIMLKSVKFNISTISFDGS